MSYISNILDKFGIKSSLAQADDFEKWLVNDVWSKYNKEKMNQRVVIENKMKALSGLRFPNGTVRKEYLAQIEIPTDLVDDVWIEGLEQIGLKCTVEDKAVADNVNEVSKTTNVDANSTGTSEGTESSIITETAEMAEIANVDDETSLPNKQPVDVTEKVASKADKLTVKVYGKPIEAGDFAIRLVYKHKGWIEGEPTSIINLPIAFNPDPRTLWKNIPTPENTTIFFKPDSESEYIKVKETEATGPRKDIVAASQRGRSHAQEGKARDDHFKIYHADDTDWYVIAVADGAGSARYSREGSRIACETVVEYCKKQLLDCTEFEEHIRSFQEAEETEKSQTAKVVSSDVYTIVGTAAHEANSKIKAAVSDYSTRESTKDVKVKDFATTLMFAICKRFDFGWFIASYWVGDGAMCLYNENNKTSKLLGVPDEGEFSGQTRFLTMPEIFKDGKAIMERLRFSVVDDFTALMLMTDGVSDPMFETENNLNSYDKWEEFWNKIKTGFLEDQIPGVELTDDNEESKNQLLRWLDFWSAGNHDDRTIAILY